MRSRSLSVLVSLALAGCAHWAYFPVYSAASAEQDAITVEYAASALSCGTLGVTNNSAIAVQLVWDEVSVIAPDGVQSKAYKGKVRVMDKEGVVPAQPIEAGAKLVESVCTEVEHVVIEPRPATTMDYVLGVVYGLGVGIANATWKPDDEAKASAMPDLASHRYDYELVVPLRSGETVVRIRVPVRATGIDAEKLHPPVE